MPFHTATHREARQRKQLERTKKQTESAKKKLALEKERLKAEEELAETRKARAKVKAARKAAAPKRAQGFFGQALTAGKRAAKTFDKAKKAHAKRQRGKPKRNFSDWSL